MLPEQRSSSEPEDLSTRQLPADDTPEDILHLIRLVGIWMDIKRQYQAEASDFLAEDQALMNRLASRPLISFSGELLAPSDKVFDALDAELEKLNLQAIFRQARGEALPSIHILDARTVVPPPLPLWPPLLLFIATIFSVLFTGTTIAIGEMDLVDPAQARLIANDMLPNIWRGWPYALSLLLILGSHEMGHYLMMRRYKTPTSLPYFIPAFMFSPFGTFGAAILLRGPLRNRRVLFDVGASGPLAGLIFAIPILFIGLATSTVTQFEGGFVEGNSILYALAKLLTFGEMLPSETRDVLVNQMAWAGWTGLFVTALNLIPLGQLDGGHVLYSLFGENARRLFRPLLIMMLALTLFVSSVWTVFLLMLFFFGSYYAVPLDNITPLGTGRRRLGIFCLVLLALIFTPVPIYQRGVSSGLLPMVLGIVASSGLLWLRHHWPMLLWRRGGTS